MLGTLEGMKYCHASPNPTTSPTPTPTPTPNPNANPNPYPNPNPNRNPNANLELIHRCVQQVSRRRQQRLREHDWNVGAANLQMDVSEVRGGHSPGGERQLSRQPSQLASHVVERPGAARRGLLEGRSLPPATTTPAPVVRAHSASLPPCIWPPLPPRSPLPPICSARW